jgi:GDP-4-dehydro-6-deoxy-D-mannose reductase
MKKILITGAGGFVGTHLIKELKSNSEIEIFAAVYKSTSDIQGLLPADHIIAGDLTDADFAKQLITLARPEIIYHLAALSVVHSSNTQALTVMSSNTAISYNLLEAVKQTTPSARVIAISSGNVYGAVQDTTHPINESTPVRPLNPYAISKVTQEMLALQYHLAYGLDTVILRPFNHTGVGQTTDFVIPSLVEQFVKIEKGLANPVVEIGNLETVRDFTDVSDMVKAYVLAAAKCEGGQIYNIGSGHGHTISEIIKIIQSLSSVKVEIKVKDNLVRVSDVPVLIADHTKFSQLTGWQPSVSLENTISDILESYRLN